MNPIILIARLALLVLFGLTVLLILSYLVIFFQL